MPCSCYPKAKAIQVVFVNKIIVLLLVIKALRLAHPQNQHRLCGLRAAGCGLRAAGCGLRAAGCGLWAVGCGLRAAGCGLWAAGCGLRAAGCGLRAAGCGLSYSISGS